MAKGRLSNKRMQNAEVSEMAQNFFILHSTLPCEVLIGAAVRERVCPLFFDIGTPLEIFVLFITGHLSPDGPSYPGEGSPRQSNTNIERLRR